MRSRNVKGYKNISIDQLIILFTAPKNQIDESVHNLFQSPFTRYQLGLEELTEGREFVFGSFGCIKNVIK